jgi:hypothetical protein
LQHPKKKNINAAINYTSPDAAVEETWWAMLDLWLKLVIIEIGGFRKD